jgi:DNA-binding transcriptional ArsR family regulator
MARSKGYKFTETQQLKAMYAKALSHPARIQIVEMLKEHNVLFFEQLEEALPLAKGSINQHLDKLDDVNLLLPAPGGFGRTGYRINSRKLADANRLLTQTLRVSRPYYDEDGLGLVG